MRGLLQPALLFPAPWHNREPCINILSDTISDRFEPRTLGLSLINAGASAKAEALARAQLISDLSLTLFLFLCSMTVN